MWNEVSYSTGKAEHQEEIPTASDWSWTQAGVGGGLRPPHPYLAQSLLYSDSHLESFISLSLVLLLAFLFLKFRYLSFDPKPWGQKEKRNCKISAVTCNCFVRFCSGPCWLSGEPSRVFQGSWPCCSQTGPSKTHSNITRGHWEMRTKHTAWPASNSAHPNVLSPQYLWWWPRIQELSSSLNRCVYMKLLGRYFINECRYFPFQCN